MHALPEHTFLSGQTVPHPPQLAGSVAVSTQVPAHRLCPVGQGCATSAVESTVLLPSVPPSKRFGSEPPHATTKTPQKSHFLLMKHPEERFVLRIEDLV